jgi:hypothetical protein
VSGVQTSGNPATTTFNYQTVDPQTGCSWRDSVADFGRSILFSNETGVYGVYGGAANRVSSKLDDLFVNAVFPADGGLTPTAAVATIYDIKHYLLLMTVTDPDTLAPRNVMLTWNEREWSITSQTPALTFIGPQKLESAFTAWGTDGQALYPLFQTPSATLVKKLYTKAYGAPQSYMIKQFDSFYVQAQDKSADQAGIEFAVQFLVSGIATQNARPALDTIQSGLYQISQPPEFVSPAPLFAIYGAQTGDLPFVTASAKITTASPDFIVANVLLSYADYTAVR